MVRKPVVAGQFYPSHQTYLNKAIENSFHSKLGPRSLPSKRVFKNNRLLGAVVPHAGYMFSGAAAAHAYKLIGESDFPDTYVFIGVNHSSTKTCSSSEDWQTLSGTIKTDRDLITELEKMGLPIDDEAHRFEHSIEVQLPFLEFVSRDRTKDLKIACIMIADSDSEKLADLIYQAVLKLNRTVVVICSSDFTHYGSNYGYVPFKNDVKDGVKDLDKKAIEHIINLDSKSFLKFCASKKATICGAAGIAVFIDLMKKLNASKGKLLQYYTSGDIVHDYKNVVGYASVAFYK